VIKYDCGLRKKSFPDANRGNTRNRAKWRKGGVHGTRADWEIFIDFSLFFIKIMKNRSIHGIGPGGVRGGYMAPRRQGWGVGGGRDVCGSRQGWVWEAAGMGVGCVGMCVGCVGMRAGVFRHFP
jgi:hypothetical protein